MRHISIKNKTTYRESESFKKYLKEISEIDLLTPEEELVCVKKASIGDEAAINELITKNLRFVISVAKQYSTPLVPLEDLVNEGNIGLQIAAKNFNPDKNVKFISYAVYWIQKIILEHLTNHSRTVRLPANKINDLTNLNKKIDALEQKMGRNIDINDVISEYGKDFKDSELETLSVLNTYTMDSLDREIGDDTDSVSLSDLISDDYTIKPVDFNLADADRKQEVERLLNGLKPRNKRVIVALYGLDGNAPMTLHEIGNELDITREMVRQIKEKTLSLLQRKLRYKSYVD